MRISRLPKLFVQIPFICTNKKDCKTHVLQSERVEKVDTLLVGDAVRSKIKDFRTALYPRQYHPCDLEKPLKKRFFAYNEFFRRTCQRKNKMRRKRRNKVKPEFIDSLRL